jgi:hypothetical protein
LQFVHHFIFIRFVQFLIISEMIDFLKNNLSSFFLIKFLLGLKDPGFLSHLIVVIWVRLKSRVMNSIWC